MSRAVQWVEGALERWQAAGLPGVDAWFVSGSGLAVEFAGSPVGSITFPELLPFPVRAVSGHSLRVDVHCDELGRLFAYQHGRLHGYQGYDPGQVVCTVRLAAELGARSLVLSNAAGGLDPAQVPGTLVLVRDHLNLTGSNPLRGELPTAWGPRFPDLGAAYDEDLRDLVQELAATTGPPLPEGVYAGLAGPSYETPAEVHMLRTLGADLVGMSTVHEVIAARHRGLRCLGISLVSNPAAGLGAAPLAHEDVLEVGRRATARLQHLWRGLSTRPELSIAPHSSAEGTAETAG